MLFPFLLQEFSEHAFVRGGRAVGDGAEKIKLHIEVAYPARALTQRRHLFQRSLLLLAQVQRSRGHERFYAANCRAQAMYVAWRNILGEFGYRQRKAPRKVFDALLQRAHGRGYKVTKTIRRRLAWQVVSQDCRIFGAIARKSAARCYHESTDGDGVRLLTALAG